MTLHLHIDRVVIDAAADGSTPDRVRLEQVIRPELAERITADGLPAGLRTSSARDVVGGVGARAERTETPSRGGIGHALYGSFQR
jgi:hypothetical protein